MATRKRIETPPAHFVPAAERHITMAIKALAAGNANDGQQRMALDWIIKVAAGTYDQTFRADADGGERASCVMAGRRTVGLAIVREINFNPALMKEA